jgi:hypothetical protein
MCTQERPLCPNQGKNKEDADRNIFRREFMELLRPVGPGPRCDFGTSLNFYLTSEDNPESLKEKNSSLQVVKLFRSA